MIRIKPVNLHGSSRQTAPSGIRLVVCKRWLQWMHEDASMPMTFTEKMNVERFFPHWMITLFEGNEMLGNG